ncbi:MAG: hypothetical protein NDJ89_05520 [Oligoflexia bacterium]|nr:hypothetical protein [Oligoflexia bacterium]
MKYFTLAMGLLTLAILAGCGNGELPDSVQSGKPAVDAPTVSGDPSAWEESYLVSPSGTVRAHVRMLPPRAIEAARKSFRQTALVAVPVDPRYNVELFRIKGVSDYENLVFIAPRVFAYGSAQGAKVAPQDNHDGTISLSLPLALIDGTRETIASSDERKSVPVPDSLRVQHQDELRKELSARFGKPLTLAPLPGCPSRITLTINDHEYDATPSLARQSNYCQLNRAIQAPLRVTIEDARYIFQKALYAGSVEAHVNYETMVPFVIGDGTIRFSKRKVFEDLAAQLSVNAGPWAEADIKAKLTQVLKNQALSLNIQGDLSPALHSVVAQALELFFEPFRPEARAETGTCGGSLVCLSLNHTRTNEQGDFEASWHQSTTGLTGEIYSTWAKMQPVQDNSVEIGGASGKPPLKNDGSSRELGLTVVPGTQLEVLPTLILSDQRLLNIAERVHTDRNVCVQTQPEMQEVCVSLPCMGNILTCTGLARSPQSCRQVKIGDRCVRTENQWVEITTYAMESTRLQPFNSPVGTFATLYDGLALKFTWNSAKTGEKRVAKCPLSAFPREADGKSLLVTLENRPKCEIFSEDSSGGVMVHLINDIRFLAPYKIGRDVQLWNGQFTERASEGLFSPEVHFSGQISVRGFDFRN